MIYVLELRKPNGSKEVLKEYYKKKQATITEFCNANLDFYQYYRSKATHLDKYYFLRGHENYKLCHNWLVIRSGFSWLDTLIWA